MTIVVDANKTNAAMVANNLFKLVNVIDVQDVTQEPSVVRDLALIKVQIKRAERSSRSNQMVDIYRAKVVDVCPESVIIEVTGPESKIDSLVEMLKPYGILEMVRTGLVAMVRGSGYFTVLRAGTARDGRYERAGRRVDAEDADLVSGTVLETMQSQTSLADRIVQRRSCNDLFRISNGDHFIMATSTTTGTPT